MKGNHYSVPVFIEVKARDEEEALDIAWLLTLYGTQETAHSIPDSRFITASLGTPEKIK